MKYQRSIKLAWTLMLALLLLALLAAPASANSLRVQVARASSATPIKANIYLTTAALQPLFQDKINQQVPGTFNNTLNGIINTLPQNDRSWASQMATTLLQPSVSLTRLTPQSGGLAATLRLSLYPGDPHPTNTTELVKFTALNATTVQVTAQALNGQPALLSGPVGTLNVPVGQLTSITTTPGCGNAALNLGLQLPLTLGQAQAAPAGVQSAPMLADIGAQAASQNAAAGGIASYIEIPAASLARLGGSIGTTSIDSSTSAQNIQVGVQNGQLVVTADILWNSIKIGVATTQVEPTTLHGGLAVHVLNTTLAVFQIFHFPEDQYNQQIQQTLNKKLNTALAGKFTVSGASIGSNSQVPCVASDSLLLSGTAGL